MARAFQGKKSWKPSHQDEGTLCSQRNCNFICNLRVNTKGQLALLLLLFHTNIHQIRKFDYEHIDTRKNPNRNHPIPKLCPCSRKTQEATKTPKKSKEKRWNQTYRFRLADDVGNCFAGLFENARCYNSVKGYIGLHIETRHSFLFLPPAPQTAFTLHLRNLCTQEWVWN